MVDVKPTDCVRGSWIVGRGSWIVGTKPAAPPLNGWASRGYFFFQLIPSIFIAVLAMIFMSRVQDMFSTYSMS